MKYYFLCKFQGWQPLYHFGILVNNEDGLFELETEAEEIVMS